MPPLAFRIFLDTPLGISELRFFILTCISITMMYLIAWLYAKYQIRRQGLKGDAASLYLKTVVTNQGRSSAFVGGAMLAIPAWGVEAGIFMAITGITLFAVMPYILSQMSRKQQKGKLEAIHLPWFLRLYPWYFIAFVLAAIILQKTTHITSRDMGDWGVLLRFYTALTIPAALYYVGSGVHIRDIRTAELKKLLGITTDSATEHWQWVRQIFIMTSVITPMIFFVILGTLMLSGIIPLAWMAVILINVALPITGTNMFLVAYGLDKRATAHAVTWTTLICVPIVVLLIELFSRFSG